MRKPGDRGKRCLPSPPLLEAPKLLTSGVRPSPQGPLSAILAVAEPTADTKVSIRQDHRARGCFLSAAECPHSPQGLAQQDQGTPEREGGLGKGDSEEKSGV